MKYLCIMLLVILGLAELAINAVGLLLLGILTFGLAWLGLYVVYEDPREAVQPWCWKTVEKMLEYDE